MCCDGVCIQKSHAMDSDIFVWQYAVDLATQRWMVRSSSVLAKVSEKCAASLEVARCKRVGGLFYDVSMSSQVSANNKGL
jgi:hypothetical protein